MKTLNESGESEVREEQEKPNNKLDFRSETKEEWEKRVANMSFKEKLGASYYAFEDEEKIAKQEELIKKTKDTGRGIDLMPIFEKQLKEMKEERERKAEIPENYLSDKYEVAVFQEMGEIRLEHGKFLRGPKMMDDYIRIDDNEQSKKIEQDMDSYFENKGELLKDEKKYDEYIKKLANDNDGEFEKFLKAGTEMNNLKNYFYKSVAYSNSDSSIQNQELEMNVLQEKVDLNNPKKKVETGLKGFYSRAKDRLMGWFGTKKIVAEKMEFPLEKELAEKKDKIGNMKKNNLEAKNKLNILEQKSEIRNKIMSDVIDKQIVAMRTDLFNKLEKSTKKPKQIQMPQSDISRIDAVVMEDVKDMLQRWEQTIFDEGMRKMIKEKIKKYEADVVEKTEMAQRFGKAESGNTYK